MHNLVKVFVSLAFISSLSASVVKLDTAKSGVKWTGTKVTGKHFGTVALKSGQLEIEKGILKSGLAVVDMKTIKVTDISGEYAQKLANHLNSKDFFAVDVKGNEVATFKTTSVKPMGKGTYKVKGALTIKKKTEEVNLTLKEVKGSFTGELKFNRTKFGIRYGSGSFFSDLGDKMINDEVTLELNLNPKK